MFTRSRRRRRRRRCWHGARRSSTKARQQRANGALEVDRILVRGPQLVLGHRLAELEHPLQLLSLGRVLRAATRARRSTRRPAGAVAPPTPTTPDAARARCRTARRASGVPKRVQKIPMTRSASSMRIASSIRPCGPSRCSPGCASVSQRHSDSRHPRSGATRRLSSSTTAATGSRSAWTSPGDTTTTRISSADATARP